MSKMKENREPAKFIDDEMILDESDEKNFETADVILLESMLHCGRFIECSPSEATILSQRS